MKDTERERNSTVRGLVILTFVASCLVATILSHPQRAKAVGPNYWYIVVVVAEGNGGTDEDCHSYGAACSDISCDDARYKATMQAIGDMPPPCQILPYHWEYEDCQEDQECTP